MLADKFRQVLRENSKIMELIPESVPGRICESLLYTKNVVYIDAQQVMPFMSETLRAQDGNIHWEDIQPRLFVLTPPSHTVWMEYPYGTNAHEKRGILLLHENFEDNLEDLDKDSVFSQKIRLGASSVIGSIHVSEDIDGLSLEKFQSIVFLKSDGTLLDGDTNGSEISCRIEPKEIYKITSTSNESEQQVKEAAFYKSYSLMMLPLMTLSLLNVKNVVTQEHIPAAKLQRSRQKKNKLPLVKSYTLNVATPGTRSVRPLGEKRPNDTEGEHISSKPLHLVRGHLADYRDGKGLFGLYKDVFWIPAHERGHIDNGIIKKRYGVKQSTES